MNCVSDTEAKWLLLPKYKNFLLASVNICILQDKFSIIFKLNNKLTACAVYYVY